MFQRFRQVCVAGSRGAGGGSGPGRRVDGRADRDQNEGSGTLGETVGSRRWAAVLLTLAACGGAGGPAVPDPGDPGGAVDLAGEVPVELPAELPAELPTELPAELPADVSADVPADVPTDLPADLAADLPDDLPDDLPADPAAEAAAEIVPADAAAEAVDPGPEVSDPCPPGMAWVDGAFCIDRWEAALQEQGADGSWTDSPPWQLVAGRTVRAVAVAGRVPQGYVSGLDAKAACEASGRRLCTSDEWLSACRGPKLHVWPYGDAHVAGACNDDYPGSPVVDFFGTSDGVWDSAHLNDPGIDQQPGTVAAAGAHPACVSDWGVYDLHGNLHEWVAEAEGTFRGGFFADGAINGNGCLYVTTAHAFAYHDYSTGFRCCLTPG